MIKVHSSQGLAARVSKHYERITLSCLLFVVASIFFGQKIGNQSLWIIVSGILTIVAITAYFINFFSEDINLLPDESDLKQNVPEVARDMRRLEQYKLIPLVLKRADQAKTYLLSQIAHELRTPLNAVTMGVDVLLTSSRANLTEDQKKTLVSLERNALDLVHLINDIVELTRLESPLLEIETFNLDDVLNNLVNKFKQDAAQKGVALDVNVQTDLPPLHSARGVLVRMLGQLISHAIKFPEAGSISVEATQSEKDPEQVEIRVKESGLGERDFSGIFDMFYEAMDEKTGATGAGLWITRYLVERLGGRVTVESEPKQTAVWKVQIPRDLSNPEIDLSTRDAQ